MTNTDLKEAILLIANGLLCETHQHVCDLRDTAPDNLVQQVEAILAAAEPAISIQTALAQLEQELAEADTNTAQ